MTRSARIALARPLRRLFDYSIPDSLTLSAGQRVQIPFGRQLATGLVVDPDATPPEGVKLKPVHRIFEAWPALPPETLTLLSWAADYYQHPLGECLFLALPPALRRGQPAQRRARSLWRLNANDPDRLATNARRQRELVSWFGQQAGPVDTAAVLRAGFSRAQLKALTDKGLVSETSAALTAPGPDKERAALPPLTNAQKSAFMDIPAGSGQFSATLLYGITGSGKTELYLHYLQQYLATSRQALVMVPEINLTPQTVTRFERYFGTRIAVWHSALNDRERLDTWLRIRDGEPVIVIGTRSAILLPFTSLGVIVVDEEHDSSYKQGEGFRYSGRDLAVYRAHLNRCPVILGSATPSLESLHNVNRGKYRLVRLEERAGNALPPRIRLLDIRSRPLQDGVAVPALSAIRECLESGRQALVFVNRRGFAPVMMCFDCGHMAECPRCDSRLTFHRRDRAMRCHHCDYQTAALDHCPKCHSAAFKPVGHGTERTEESLAAHFPDVPVIRVDRDSTQRKGSINDILTTVNSGQPCILVGTQMLAKGHDFPNVTLVLVINADGGLFSIDFRAPEHLIQTLLQVSGRAGRGEHPGKVIVQTCHSDHPLLQTLCSGHYLTLAEQLLNERSQAGFPPFRAMAILRADGPAMTDSLQFLDAAKQRFDDPRLELWGPLPALIARRADRHRAQLVVLSDHRPRLQQMVAQVCQQLDATRHNPRIRWQIDVDPWETG